MSGSGTSVGAVSVTLEGDAKPVVDAFAKATDKVDDFEEKLKKTSDAASKVTSRVDELRTKQEQLTRALVDAASATDRDQAKVNALRNELEATTGSLNRLTNAQQVSVATQQKIHVAQTAAATSSRNLGGAVLEVSRGFEDAQYGMAGLLNNIPSLVTMLGGGMGLAGIISIVAVGVSILVKNWDDFAPAVDKAVVAARAHVEELDGDLKRLKTTMDTLTGRENKANERLVGALTGVTDKDERTIRAVKAEADGLEMELRAIGKLADPGFLGRAFEADHITDSRNKLKELREELKRLNAEFKEVGQREGWNGRGLDVKADEKSDKAAEKADQRSSDRAVTIANKEEAAYQRSLRANGRVEDRAEARAERIETKNDQASRDLVSAIGFDAAAMSALGQNTAALILAAQANDKLVSEFPDPGDPAFNLPAEGLKLAIDPEFLGPALGKLETLAVLEANAADGLSDGLAPAIDGLVGPFKATAGRLEGLGEGLDAGQQGLLDFGNELSGAERKLTKLADAQAAGDMTADIIGGTAFASLGKMGGTAAGAAFAPAIGIDPLTGGAIGGVIGGMLGGMVDDLQPVMDVLTIVLGAVGVIVAALSPMLEPLVPIAAVLGSLLEAVAPAIAIFAGYIGAILEVVGVILEILQPFLVLFVELWAAFTLWTPLFALLTPVLRQFADWLRGAIDVVSGFVSGITDVINDIVGFNLVGQSGEKADAAMALTEAGGAAGDALNKTLIRLGILTEDNTKATRDLTRSQTNVPDWYRTPLAEYRSAGGSSSSTSSGAMIINGPIIIQNAADTLKETLRREEMKRRGTPVPSRGRDEAN